MSTELRDWQERLAVHFAALRERRHADGVVRSIFGLEHGLALVEVQSLEDAIRDHIAQHRPSRDHRLAWIVYSSEVGYRYSGDEYWQTFEEETPGWIKNGDRYRIRDFFRQFQRDFGGAVPSGPWAEHFSIICWPITHAILPKDLQRQLARNLYDLRHSFTGDVLGSPDLLGELIAARSWNTTSRFQNFVQDPRLVGQISSALLFQGDTGSNELIHPSTLERISNDLDGERRARDWLRTARRSANERIQIRGLGHLRHRAARPPINRLDEARTEIEILGIEPRLVLRPTDSSGELWDVSLEIPNLSHLLLRFPQTKEILTSSRCVVAGTSGRPLARGRLLHGYQRIKLVRWPKPDDVLIRFENSDPQLDYLLRTECLLRPGTKWLFRIASDGLAYEHRSLRVRPGEQYIVVSTAAPVRSDGHTNPIDLICEGAHAEVIQLPTALTTEWQRAVQKIGLGQARTVEVWPAGLSAAEWDGEGHGEWLASERPRLGIQADHPLTSVRITMNGDANSALAISSMKPGQPAFVEFPPLSVGVHRLNFSVRSSLAGETQYIDDLQAVIRIREDRPGSPFVHPGGPLSVEVDPTLPTLEQLWEGAVGILVRGPRGREVGTHVSLFERDAETAFYTKQLPPVSLPVTSEDWTTHFRNNFQQESIAQEAYDRAHFCSIDFSADELGAFKLRCERDFTPLRWAIRRYDNRHMVRLYDDTGVSDKPLVSRSAFETPCIEEPLGHELEYQVPFTGGLYAARIGEYSASIVVPPEFLGRGLAELGHTPEVERSERSLDSVIRVVEIAGLWGQARLSGGLLSAIRQRNVMEALVSELFRLICGENWARAEEDFLTNGDSGALMTLSQAISRNPGELAVNAVIVRDLEIVASATPSDRVRILASLAFNNRLLPDSILRRTSNSQEAQRFDTPRGLSELALRLASDPAIVGTWAGQELRAGLRLLLETPSLERAARFLVLATERFSPTESLSGSLYAGWRWA